VTEISLRSIARPHWQDAGATRVAFALVLLAIAPCVALANDFPAERNRMVDQEIVAAGVKDSRVVQSLRDTLRHEFVPLNQRAKAYYDMALPLGWGQTISPPFIVAYMTEALDPQPADKVLEIGTGSGYQAAVLAPLVSEVYTIEIVKPLGERAARTLKRLKYDNVFVKVGDGYQGWAEHAPFDKIIVTCSPEKVPPKLVEQLREGGKMLVPVGERYQQSLYAFMKKDGQLEKTALLPVLFVPMTGKAEEGREVLPDAARPQIVNGNFEAIDPSTKPAAVEPSESAAAPSPGDQSEREEPAPDGWYYRRQLQWMATPDAPEGEYYATFKNTTPGRGAQALQGLAIDGRHVKQVDVSLWVKGENLRLGESPEQQPMLAITFYDENRAQAGYTVVGPWRDTFDWKRYNQIVRVPTKAREAILCLGLCGATGEISFDDVRIEPVAK
jgi:protein-L-isoaspartate(D-aspartate) O-methyltransferase